MKYPKLWDGPNPVGEAKVRQLQQVDAPFLSASGPGFFSATTGGFSEVRGGLAVEYSATGRVRQEGVERLLQVTAVSYKQPFLPRGVAQSERSNRRKLLNREVRWTDYSRSFKYPSGDSTLFDGFTFDETLFEGRLLSRRRKQIGSFQTLSVRPANQFSWRPSYYRIGLQRHVIDVVDRNPKYFLTGFLDTGLVDAAGAPCPLPAFFTWEWGSEDDVRIYGFPEALLPNSLPRRYEPPTLVSVGRNKLYVLLISNWMYSNNHTDDVSARARLFYSTNGGASWTVRDVTAQLLDPDLHPAHKEPLMRYSVMGPPPSAPNGGVWQPPLEDDYWSISQVHRDRATGLPEGGGTEVKYLTHINETFPGSGVYTYVKNSAFVHPHTGDQQRDVVRNYMYITARFIAVGEGRALLSVLHHDGNNARNVGALYSVSPTGFDRLWSSEPGEAFSYIQHMVYLGGGVVLAKRTFGFDTANADVRFEISLNGGESFQEVDAVGLPGHRKNRYFGDFTLVAPYVDDSEQGVVLIPAFDEALSGYYAYESRDSGRTWRRRGRLAKTDAFFRVDTMIVGDGGGNFERIEYFGSLTKPSRWNPAIEEMNLSY